MVTILNRARDRGYIKKSLGKYFPVEEKVLIDDFSLVSKDEERKLNNVIESLIIFSDKKYNAKFEKNKAEEAFLGFLNDKDLDEIFNIEGNNPLLPKSTLIQGTEKFIIGRFIEAAEKSDPELFRFIVDIKIGQALAHTILFNELKSYECNLKGLNYYLDVGFLFALNGIDGEKERVAYEELIFSLKDAGANLYIFEHTEQEFIANITYCLNKIGSSHVLNIEKEKRALRHFIEYGAHETDIEMLLARFPTLLQKYGIEVADNPSFDDHLSQISEDKLKEAIVGEYSKKYPASFDIEEKQPTINKDVKSISSIYRLRKGNRPKSLKDASHVFITTNTTLARVCSIFDRQEYNAFTIPACLHDIVIGTLLWLQRPAKAQILNEKKLIADVSAALRPSDELLKKYLTEIEKLKHDQDISEKEFYLLRTNRVALSLLQEKTVANPENFKSTTPSEILLEIKSEISKEESGKYEKMKNKIDQENKLLNEKHETLQKDYNIQSRNVEMTLRRVGVAASLVSWLISFSIFLLLIYILYLVFNPDTSTEKIIGFLFSVAGFFGFDIFVANKFIKDFIGKKIIKYFVPYVD